jgi:drug/metabolite transporter (DMT)-like permease
VRVAALLLAFGAAASWGIGGILLKRGTDHVSPTTILIFQYALGAALVGVWIAVTGGAAGFGDAVGRRWAALLVIALFQIAGYVFFISSVRYAGEGSIPTAVAVAISAAYPALVALLSGPFLGENLGWNHVAGVLLVVGGVIVAQAF